MQSILQLNSSNPSYPNKLRNLVNHPYSVYVSGNIKCYENKTIGVIGTRKVSDYGNQLIKEFIPPLIREGYCVVSGLAPGIDSLAHSNTLLLNGCTIGVLGFGFDYIKKSYNFDLAQKISISKNGLLISPFSLNQPPTRNTFIERNKIIAALGDYLLVLEAPEKSGVFYTVSSALDQGKDVFVVPGSIFSVNSCGTNNLIKSGAIPVTSADDILLLLKGSLAN